jgi:dolichyl-diphosphooligosaccharide---protein glycosyltransferase
VGTTIYPAMQFTAIWIKRYIFGDRDDTFWTLNNVCVYMPAWFGVIATLLVGAIAYEASIPVNSSGSIWQFALDFWNYIDGQPNQQQTNESTSTTTTTTTPPVAPSSTALECACAAMAIMAIVPAHLMRSMGGGYDNESVAVTAMVNTFYWWMRSLRDETGSWKYGVVTGLAYFYMVAAWGGYVFVLNMIGVHAAVLVGLGRFKFSVWASYSLFFVVGTALAIQVPVVGWSPLKSLEQLGPAAVFLAYQLLMLGEFVVRRNKNTAMTRTQQLILRVQILGGGLLLVLALATFLAPTGYFGPISSRVRGLFVQHTKTGNPLVDSVAEHQPASSRAYFQYLHYACVVAPAGYLYVWLFGLSNASSFLVVWGTAAYFFSHKMVRLILLTAPISSALGGIAIGRLFSWCLAQWWEEAEAPGSAAAPPSDNDIKSQLRKKKVKKAASSSSTGSFEGFVVLKDTLRTALRTREGIIAKRVVSLGIIGVGYLMGSSFVNYCWTLAYDLANPSIILKARTTRGDIVKLDDYREAYWWLRDNTPEDSRIMAWWDYGYQISAIANRTTIADGNTWNHEHIALLGKALTTDLDEGWEIARHLADYVLIWGGGGGDDLAKSPHLARIANSVYRDHCPDDPTCRAFGFLDRQGTPSAMMSRSFLYRLHSHEQRPGVTAPADKFLHVYQSKYGKVRIFKILGVDDASKAWVEDAANRRCDVPGSWFCPGQYPPGLSAILSKKKDFSQLEDFNKANADEEYTKQYFEDLRDPGTARRKAMEKEADRSPQLSDTSGGLNPEDQEAYKEKIEEIYHTWEDTDDTTRMWQLISSNNVAELQAWLALEPHKAFVRSKDGRGPMFWAFEQRNEAISKLLMKAGVPHTDKDARGLSAVDLLGGKTM